MEHDAWFFIGVFVFIFLLWIATGGPVQPLSFSGPTLAQPQELGGGTYLQLPRAPFGIDGSSIALPGSSWIQGSGSYTQTSPYAIPLGPFSLYRDVITVRPQVVRPDTRDEYVEISLRKDAASPVTITGWALVSEVTGLTEIIPQGVAVPTLGVVNYPQNIVLYPGDRAYISTGPSPIGVSFRESVCTGYLNNFQKFVPSLPQNCPSVSDDVKRFYGSNYVHDTACITYAEDQSTCRVPTISAADLSSTCTRIITDYANYNGCVRAHSADPTFAGTTWHIYLGRTNTSGKTKPMWRTDHEIVKLMDERYKTVASFDY